MRLFIHLILGVVVSTISLVGAGQVKVHFVPHSHLDAGWLKTYDEYFEKEVWQIFSKVIRKLSTDPKYTYTIGDIAFFRQFYQLTSQHERNLIHALVEGGQLEFVQGGMVSPDEACPNYGDIIRNFELGHQFL